MGELFDTSGANLINLNRSTSPSVLPSDDFLKARIQVVQNCRITRVRLRVNFHLFASEDASRCEACGEQFGMFRRTDCDRKQS